MMLAGFLCLSTMPISEYPEVSPPTITVRMNYPGASPEELAQVVAAPVEEQLIGIEDLAYFSSNSTSDGSYSLTLIFNEGTDDDIAMINVSNAIKRVESRLPGEIIKRGYQVNKRSSDTLCMLSFNCDESKISTLELINWLRMNLKDRIGKLDGISEVDILPRNTYSMRIWMNTMRMNALNITPSDINKAVKEQNIQAAAGSIGAEDDDSLASFKVTATGRLKDVSQFENIVIKRGANGHITRLKDVAHIELGAESVTVFRRQNGRNGVSFKISRNNDANALATIEMVKAELKSLEHTFPESVEWSVAYDPTLSITATMKEIIYTLVLALSLVIFVTYLFLQNWRATLIPALAIPVSLLGAFTVMSIMGYTINTLTMFGLILVIGSLVDDAIVVVENVMRIIEEEKLSPREATLKSMKQISGAVIATTLVTLAVYVPIAFYGGMVGVIYEQFSVTMCIALCISTFNALTLSPALCAVLLKPSNEKKSRISEIIFAPFNFCLNIFRRFYIYVTRILIKKAWLTVIIYMLILGGNYYYFMGAPSSVEQFFAPKQEENAQAKAPAKRAQKQQGIYPLRLLSPKAVNNSFVPTEDKGSLFVMGSLEGTATSKQRTDKVIRNLEQKIMLIPGVLDVLGMSGFNFMSGNGENNGMLIVTLIPWDERKSPELKLESIQGKINLLCAKIPEGDFMARTTPAIPGLGIAGGVSVVLQASGDATPQDLSNAVKELSTRLESNDELVSLARSSYNAETPQIYLNINREKAQSLGIPVVNIFSTLQSVLASSYINDFTLNGFSFKVIMQGMAEDRRTAEEILNIMVRNETGLMVPLNTVCTLSYRMAPSSYFRFNQLMSASINVQPKPGAASGEIMQLIEDNIAAMNQEEQAAGSKLQWSAAWKDLSYQERQNKGKLGPLVAMAIIFAYLFLVAQYESWTTPIPVVLSVAVASLGALMGIQLFGLSLSIYVQLGIIMLIGLASKNAILIVEFSKAEHEQNHTPIPEAALLGASKRFRAVLMTAISFLCGVFPMVIGEGAGAASRQEIGITTFFGMLLATVWGIFMVPALYSIFARMRDHAARMLGKETP